VRRTVSQRATPERPVRQVPWKILKLSNSATEHQMRISRSNPEHLSRLTRRRLPQTQAAGTAAARCPPPMGPIVATNRWRNSAPSPARPRARAQHSADQSVVTGDTRRPAVRRGPSTAAAEPPLHGPPPPPPPPPPAPPPAPPHPSDAPRRRRGQPIVWGGTHTAAATCQCRRNAASRRRALANAAGRTRAAAAAAAVAAAAAAAASRQRLQQLLAAPRSGGGGDTAVAHPLTPENRHAAALATSPHTAGSATMIPRSRPHRSWGAGPPPPPPPPPPPFPSPRRGWG